MTITNTGASDLVVSNVTIGGTNPNQFALAGGQADELHRARRPDGDGRRRQFTATTAFGMQVATLNIASNDPLDAHLQVALRGFNAGGTVGDTEPGFQDLMTTLGYSTVTGINGTYKATTRAPVGDEIIAPYFKRVDTSKPVGALPRSPATSPPPPSPRTPATRRTSTRPAAPRSTSSRPTSSTTTPTTAWTTRRSSRTRS